MVLGFPFLLVFLIGQVLSNHSVKLHHYSSEKTMTLPNKHYQEKHNVLKGVITAFTDWKSCLMGRIKNSLVWVLKQAFKNPHKSETSSLLAGLLLLPLHVSHQKKNPTEQTPTNQKGNILMGQIFILHRSDMLHMRSLKTAHKHNRDQSSSRQSPRGKSKDLWKSGSSPQSYFSFHEKAEERISAAAFLLSLNPGNSDIFIITAHISFILSLSIKTFSK